jgi:multisubunit Na+/H+ antiporter MnhB subunit
MLEGYTTANEGLIGFTNLALSVIVILLLLYYFRVRSKLDELSGRFLLAGFFLGVHELTFFLGDPFVQELTKTLFFIALFFALLFIVQNNKALEETLTNQGKLNEDLKERLDELKKEIG